MRFSLNSLRFVGHNSRLKCPAPLNHDARKLGLEPLEQRALLSATDHGFDAPAALIAIGEAGESTPVPAEFAEKVDAKYWALAEEVRTATQDGVLAGTELNDALENIDPSRRQLGIIDAAGALRTVIQTGTVNDRALAALESAGVDIDESLLAAGGNGVAHGRLYGWIPAHMVDDVASLSVVTGLESPVNGVADVGDVDTEGDALLRADRARNVFGLDGSGVRVGVISTGVPNRGLVQATSDLPGTITIDPARSGMLTNDEGTAMLEIVHDMAPGAELFFSGFIHLGFDGLGREITQFTTDDMVDSINWMVSQGVDVIVDDLQFFNEPAFEDGAVADAAAAAVAAGVTFVTAAGNRADRHYQGDFDLSVNNLHDFSLPAVDNFFDIDVAPLSTVRAWLHWSDEWGASGNNYNLFITDANGFVLGVPGVLDQNGNDDPIEEAVWTNPTGTVQRVFLLVQRVSGVDRELEIYITPTGIAVDNDATTGDSMFGHKAVEGVITAGAIDASDPGTDTIREFSSRGPATIYTNFATQTSTERQSLDGAGINGVETRIGQLGFFSNPFFGTSAAAPHVAGIVALMLENDSSLTPEAVSQILNDSAQDIEANGYDNVSGSGRFDAFCAVNTGFLPGGLDLMASHDTGTCHSDNVTKLQSLDVQIPETVPLGQFVWIYDFVSNPLGDLITSFEISSAPDYFAKLPNQSDGVHEYRFHFAANQSVPYSQRSPLSDPLEVTIDTTPPSLDGVTPVASSLLPGASTGFVLDFSELIPGIQVEPGAFAINAALFGFQSQQGVGTFFLPTEVQSVDGTTGESWQFNLTGYQDVSVAGTPSDLKGIGLNVSNTAGGRPAIEDVAGNPLPFSAFNYWPFVPAVHQLTQLDMNPASDTGVSSTDNVTNNSQPVFNVTTIPNAYVRLYFTPIGGGAPMVVREEQFPPSGVLTPISLIPTSPVADGEYNVTFTVAANVGSTESAPSPPLAVKIDTVAPRIQDVIISNGTKDYSVPGGSGAQLIRAPIYQPDRVRIEFDHDLADENFAPSTAPALVAGDMELVGGGGFGASYATNGVTYNSATNTATWILSAAILGQEQINLKLLASVTDIAGNALDGDWLNNPNSTEDTGTTDYPSGNGAAGGDLTFRFTLMPGDAIGAADNIIGIDDLNAVRNNFGQSGLNQPGDADFDGDVDIDDLNLVRNNFGDNLTSWPTGAMAMAAPGVITRGEELLRQTLADLYFDRISKSDSSDEFDDLFGWNELGDARWWGQLLGKGWKSKL